MKEASMIRFEILNTGNRDIAAELYRNMIDEYRERDPRFGDYRTDDKSIANLLAYSLDVEDNLFYLAFRHAEAIGFIDSTRIRQDTGAESWYVKSVFLIKPYRSFWYFDMLLQKLESAVAQKGVRTIFSTAFLDDSRANDLWNEAGYVIEKDRRIKELEVAPKAGIA
jgi:GNAT superfamily N-acetyltransferase